jgi:hypothetical protein
MTDGGMAVYWVEMMEIYLGAMWVVVMVDLKASLQVVWMVD